MERIKKLFFKYVDIIFLVAIVYIAIYVRWMTADISIPLDYDPWWFFRHSQEILNNNLQPPKWDIQSFYPPGRPVDFQLGWDYMIVLSFKIISFFTAVSFTKFAIYAPAFAAGLSAIPAYMTGRLITNRWGGLATALFATLPPAFIGVSMAGYLDSDAVVVFLSFLSAFGLLYALKKRTKFAYAVAVFTLWLFAVTWNQPWYILLLFYLFLPFYWIYQILHGIWYEGKRNITSLAKEKFMLTVKNFLKPLLIVSVIATIVTLASGVFGVPVYDPITTLASGLKFLGGRLLLVNISVAELQKLDFQGNFFTVLETIANRVGSAPFYLSIVGLPLIIIIKFWKKMDISFAEVFTVLWLIVTFYLISNGIRFSLLFSIAVAAAAGFVIGNITKYLRQDAKIKEKTIHIGIIATIYGVLLFGIITYVSIAIQVGAQGAGMEVSQNWVDAFEWLKKNADNDSLIVTWWDPGHIIAGYTGLKVLADGAHCAPGTCIPYDHNIRIQDTGRMFSISDENESVNILRKYKSLTPEQCQEVRDKYGSIVPQDACKPVSKMYVIASSDLIGKYHWMSYFGTGTAKDFFQLSLTNVDQSQGILSYQNGLVTLVAKGDKLVPVYNNQMIIREMVYFPNGIETRENFADQTDTVDGLLWIDPSYSIVIFMQPEVRDSIFTKMFFWNGKELNNFKLVYNNPELRIFEVIF